MWKYVGNGEWIPGVPARDLTDAEVAAFEACTEPSQVWLKDADGNDYPFNVVPVSGKKALADDTELRFGIATSGLYEHVKDARAKAETPALAAEGGVQ